MHSGDKREDANQSAYVTMYGLAVTSTFDLKSNQFIFVPNCT